MLKKLLEQFKEGQDAFVLRTVQLRSRINDTPGKHYGSGRFLFLRSCRALPSQSALLSVCCSHYFICTSYFKKTILESMWWIVLRFLKDKSLQGSSFSLLYIRDGAKLPGPRQAGSPPFSIWATPGVSLSSQTQTVASAPHHGNTEYVCLSWSKPDG